jgi:biopolymer transport protein ExbD
MSRFGRLGSREAPPPLHDINITPLVDVMLVLLVLFLLGAPLAVQRLALELPAVPGATAASAPALLSVEIDADGRVRVDGQALPPGDATFSAMVAAAAQQRPDGEVRIQADARAPYGRVAEVIGLVQAAGLSRIGLVSGSAPP